MKYDAAVRTPHRRQGLFVLGESAYKRPLTCAIRSPPPLDAQRPCCRRGVSEPCIRACAHKGPDTEVAAMVGGVVGFLVDDLGFTGGRFQEMGHSRHFYAWLTAVDERLSTRKH